MGLSYVEHIVVESVKRFPLFLHWSCSRRFFSYSIRRWPCLVIPCLGDVHLRKVNY